MTELLLQDQGSEQEQSSLIEIMACSVKQLTTGDLPKYRSGARKVAVNLVFLIFRINI